MIYNRDISWLDFNERVLREAADPEVPLMERVKFLSIFSSNLDEFFRVRFPEIIALSALGNRFRKKTLPPTGKDLAKQVKTIVNGQFEQFGKILNQEILPQLEKEGIVLYYNRLLEAVHSDEVKEIFLSRILAFIQPLFINDDFSDHFIPENDNPYLVVTMQRAGADSLKHAVVNIPSGHLPRFFTLSPIGDTTYIIFIDDIIRENLECLFPGFTIKSASSFKISRNAELLLDEGLGTDILKEIEKKLEKQKLGKPSRFLFQKDMPHSLQLYLKSLFKIKDDELFEGGRYHNLKDLFRLPVNNAALFYEQQKPLPSIRMSSCGEMFDILKRRDLLLHFPYHSYNPVLSFFNQAATDPEVRSIQITLYRIASDSHIANALISAAKNGKKVLVFVELKARFDEANNIYWSKEMKRAGIKIIYGIPGIKVHSKIALVEKDNASYSLIGTGNFNENTAQVYADHILFTRDQTITSDIKKLFTCLQNPDCQVQLATLRPTELLISQVNMLSTFERLIREQIGLAKKGLPAFISMKMNSLQDFDVIQMLYKASKAGVEVRLLIRGICCIFPGKAGLSESIKVKRIVDRYLEHSRIYIFGRGEHRKIFIGSADCMTRNLHYRIEVCTPVKDTELQDDLVAYFELQWSDNVKSVTIDEQQQQHRSPKLHGDKDVRAQYAIYELLKNKVP